MKTFEITFLHIDGDIRAIKIDAFNEEREVRVFKLKG